MGRGAVWLEDDVAADAVSDPMLFAGFDHRGLHLMHRSEHPLKLAIELDIQGKGEWQAWKEVELSEQGYTWIDLGSAPGASWIRLRSQQAAKQLTAWFTFSRADHRDAHSDRLRAFAPISAVSESTKQQQSTTPSFTGGSVRARGNNKRTLHYAAERTDSAGTRTVGLYELDGTMTLRPDTDTAALDYHQKHAAIPSGVLSADAASVIYIDDAGKRWRLPRASAQLSLDGANSRTRVCREVKWPRNLTVMQCRGTFYDCLQRMLVGSQGSGCSHA